MEEQCKKVQNGKVNIYDEVYNWFLWWFIPLYSDHHKRQESYLEDRCEELIKHNEHLMNVFKSLHEQVAS